VQSVVFKIWWRFKIWIQAKVAYELWNINSTHLGHDRMVVALTTTCAISAYHHIRCRFESHTLRGVLDTILCDTICQWLSAGQFSPVSCTNKTDRHSIHVTEILLKVALTHTQEQLPYYSQGVENGKWQNWSRLFCHKVW
jgi:hypothetical protein